MKIWLVHIILITFINLGCAYESLGQYDYQQPEDLKDGIITGVPAEVGIDLSALTMATNRIKAFKYGEVHSMLIYKDNKLVFEAYFPGHLYQWERPHHHGEWVNWDHKTLHDVKSVTKSITGICIGIAIEKGYIESVDQSIFDYLHDYKYLKEDGRENITIEHLLTMTSGFQWNEWGAPLSSPKNDIIGLWFHCEDQIRCILERPVVYEPGSVFTYNGGNMILLGEIIKNATGMPIDLFSTIHLFEPLGIDTSDWNVRYPNGTIESGGGLYLTPRAMLKIGITCLNNGKWQNRQIIPEWWIEKIKTEYKHNRGIKIPGIDSGRNGYGYSWWINEFPAYRDRHQLFYAAGWGGQKIIVIPEKNMVVVFTGGNYTSSVKVFSILRHYVIPSLSR